MKRYALIIVIILLIPFSLAHWNILIHNGVAYLSARQLTQMPLPDSTELVGVRHRVIPDHARDSECRYSAVALLDSELTVKQVREFYVEYDEFNNQSLTRNMNVYVPPLDIFQSELALLGTITQEPPKNYVHLVAVSKDIPAYLDFRCWNF